MWINRRCAEHSFSFLQSITRTSPMPSSTTNIDLYLYNIHMEVSHGTNKLNYVKRLAVIQNEPFGVSYSRMNHLCHYWNKHMLTIVQNTFYNRCAWWLPLIDERFVIDKLVTISIILFFGLGVTNNAAKPNSVVSIGDDGSSNEGCSSSKLIVIKINETQLS